ncbi:MAG: hypothetical protein JNL98_34145, partial [Bryobacterales bacterium]|nr:hypothetical protein [Bryobacterales bacterium]
FGQWLLGCDRIALDCYQAAYLGLGKAKSIPAPPPFCYMRTGFSPATYRRGIRLTRLGKQINPFPLIQIPYHRLVNPWALGAILHEVSHNLQNELGLADVVPLTVGRELHRAGLPRLVASTWQRWNRETFADIAGLVLGGPGVAGSLMDVIGRAPKTVVTFVPDAPHPTPWLRMLITLELLKRMGFARQAEEYRRLWLTMYPDPGAGTIPPALLETAHVAIPMVVSIMAFRRWPSLGDKALAEVIRFGPKEQSMVEETAHRLASGNDPGIVPERFLIGAARFAVDRKLAPAETIQRNFYKELARR